jgi:N-methylhydantoinase A
MASAARIHAIERGRTISQFPMFAFGGAGPVHAYGVARVLRLPKIIFPFGAGVMSAIGFLTAPLAFDFVRSSPARLEHVDWAQVNRMLADMEDEGRARLSASLGGEKVSFRCWADMRYRKQGFDIRVPIPAGGFGPYSVQEITASFERVYSELYGHTVPNTPIDVISWRVVAAGPKPNFSLPVSAAHSDNPRKGSRKIYVPETGLVEVPVYDRYRLGAGDRLQGPAVIEERESTVVINGPGEISVDHNRNLIVDLEASK